MTTSAYSSQIIGDDENYRITFHGKVDNPDPRVLITFGPVTSDLGSVGFGTEFARSQGLDTIYVAQRKGTFYQGLSLEAFHGAVGPVMDGRRAYAYGSSLGGYCALFYGSCVDARILAFSPRNSAHPAINGKAYGEPLLGWRHPELSDLTTPTHPVLVAFDPVLKVDKFVVERLVQPAFAQVVSYQVPYSGHNIPDRMLRAGSLKAFVCDYLDDNVPQRVRIIEEGCHLWHSQKARHYKLTKNYAAAEAELRAAFAANQNRLTTNNLLSFLLQRRTTEEVSLCLESLNETELQKLISPGLRAKLSSVLPRFLEEVEPAGIAGNQADPPGGGTAQHGPVGAYVNRAGFAGG